jgi:nucleotide-binding universal stress UspA family protein
MTGGGKSRTIVIALDESPVSKATLEWSVDNLIHKGDNIRLVSIVDSNNRPVYATPGGVPIEIESAPDKEQLARRSAMLDEYRNIAKKKVGDAGVKASTVVSRSLGTSSDHGREICEFAAESQADILVMGSRGYGSFKRSIMSMFGLGSVSNFVLNHAPVSNIMIHKHSG